MTTCKIQWVDENGHATPDTRPAVGEVYREAYTDVLCGRVITFEETKRFPICAYHAVELNRAGMERWHFLPYPGSILLPR